MVPAFLSVERRMPWPSSAYAVAEVDGNRTRQPEMLGLNSFEDRGDHQVLAHLRGQFSPVAGCPDCPKWPAVPATVTPTVTPTDAWRIIGCQRPRKAG